METQLYITTSSRLDIVDVSDFATPVYLSEIRSSGGTDLTLSNDGATAYVVGKFLSQLLI